ncbi:MAG: AAA family ATPase [Planctomycetes bacterium]|nr:AAA family ATPase [Planctomycetota bacterium]
MVATQSTMVSVASSYLAAGLCVLPAIRAEKRPAVGQWKRYRERLPTEAELAAWFANGPDALCILCGGISGNAEMIDFDAGGELYEPWARRIPNDLLARLVVETTQRGGRHVIYRCETPVCGNMKLAQRRDNDKTITLIETRGEGGLLLCTPTAGYELIQGDLSNPPVLTEGERDALLAAAWELNEYLPPPVPEARPCGQGDAKEPNVGALSGRPGDDFNRRGDVRAILEQAGWSLAKPGENEYWRRPGKTSGWSASLKGGVFYVFSANAAPFEPNRAYSPFTVYTLLKHGGDFERAAGELRGQGFGADRTPSNGVDISGLLTPSKDLPSPPLTFDLQAFSDTPERQVSWLWPGVIPRGMLSLVGGKQGLGKSFLICDLAARVSAGRPMPAGLANAPGNVLLLAREDDASCVLLPRLRAAKADLSRVWWSVFANATTGSPIDLASHVDLLARVTADRAFDLIVVDTFASFAPVGTDSNAAQDVRLLLDSLTRLARTTGAAVVVVAHLRKTGQGDGDPMDAVAGSVQMTAGVRVASMLDKGVAEGERWFRVVKSNLGRIDEQGWTWRFAWPDAFTEGASEMPHLEWAVAGKAYRDLVGTRSDASPNPRTMRDTLLAPLADGPRHQREVVGLALATLRTAHPRLSREAVELALDELIRSCDGTVEVWEGPRGARMIGLPGSKPESPEERAMRLARENPNLSAREFRAIAGCRAVMADRIWHEVHGMTGEKE